MTEIGRPEYTDTQYQEWLEDMTPLLKLGNSLNYAIEKAALSKHKTAIYEKYRLKDWFSEKIDTFQSYPGEIVNSIFVRLVLSADEKLKQGGSLSDEDWRNLRFFAEKHRGCQQFFISRQEVVQTEPNIIGVTLDTLEQSDYRKLGINSAEELKKLKTQTSPSPELSNPVQA